MKHIHRRIGFASLALCLPAALLASTAVLAAVEGDLITSSLETTPWQECDTDNLGVDVANIDATSCAYRATPATAGVEYKMTCGVRTVKYASITLAFLDANDNTLTKEVTEIYNDGTAPSSVTLTAPAGTATAAIGVYGEHGSGFQDCVLVDNTSRIEGSIAGDVWFDANGNSSFNAAESLIPGVHAVLSKDGTQVATTSTGTDGSYRFTNLDIDSCYVVTFVAPDDSLAFGPFGSDNAAGPDGNTQPICLSANDQNITDIDAGLVQALAIAQPGDVAICGTTWIDANENGVFDGDDTTVKNVLVNLFNQIEGTQINLRSGDDGTFAFTGLPQGIYNLDFRVPNGHWFTVAGATPVEGGNLAAQDGRTPSFNLPQDTNTAANAACTLEHVNAGFKVLDTAIAPTFAGDDSVTAVLGDAISVPIIDNDQVCDDEVEGVDLLGHNLPGTVSYDATTKMLNITDVNTTGTFTVEYGVRGACGSYDRAFVTVEIIDAAPENPLVQAPVCRVETGGSTTIGGVDVFSATENGFLPTYRMYDRERTFVIELSSDDVTHKQFRNRVNQWEINYQGMWEIEWNGTQYNYDQVSVYYVSGVENGVESELTECVRHFVSPIAIDMNGDGRIHTIGGSFNVDVDNDGIADHLQAWFGPSDAILLPKKAEEFIGSAVTGELLFGAEVNRYKDGFEELATLDSDNSNALEGKELDGLMLWFDRNSDTIIDATEIQPMQNLLPVTSIPVSHYKFVARLALEDNESILMEDVWFPLAPVNTAGK